MNKLALVAVPVAILAAAACALPWYLGMQTEQAMRAEVSKMASSAQFPLNVTFMRYDRGWLSSTAVTRLTLKAEPSRLPGRAARNLAAAPAQSRMGPRTLGAAMEWRGQDYPRSLLRRPTCIDRRQRRRIRRQPQDYVQLAGFQPAAA